MSVISETESDKLSYVYFFHFCILLLIRISLLRNKHISRPFRYMWTLPGIEELREL